MNAPILVTGGAGFLGGWLVRRLVERGEPVRVLDLPQARWSQLAQLPVEFVRGDIRDRAVVTQAVRGCRAVCHVAGLPQLWTQPRHRFEHVNHRGAVQVLDEAVRAGCERIVHVSSATIWPLGTEASCHWRDALGSYCRSKLRAERYAQRLARRGAPLVIVSPTLPIGPGDPARTPPTQLLLDGCRGDHPAYVDMQLNLIDARDVAEGISRALDVGVPGTRYLLGSTTVSLLELLQRLSRFTGRPPPRWRVPYPVALAAGLVAEWWAEVVSGQAPTATAAGVRLSRRPLPVAADADLRSLGVTPRPLAQTLEDTVRWFRDAGWLPAISAT